MNSLSGAVAPRQARPTDTLDTALDATQPRLRDWFSAAELAAFRLPGLPTHRTAFQRHVTAWRTPRTHWDARSNPHGLWRKRAGRGGGYEYHISLLPLRARRQVMQAQGRSPQAAQQAAQQVRPRPPAQQALDGAGMRPLAPQPGRLTPDQQAARHAQAWVRFDSLGEAAKERAAFRLQALEGVDQMVRSGMPREVAVQLVGDEMGFRKSAYYIWVQRVSAVPRADRLPYLADYRPGRVALAKMSPDAWELFKSEYLRPEKRTFSECYTMVCRANEKGGLGWDIPSLKTFRRRIERDVDRRVQVLTRDGAEAHDRLYPAQRRDRAVFHAMQALNYDGHRLDVFVRWPDGSEGRAYLIAFQDLYSGKIVGWRLDRAETPFAFRLAFLDAVERYGFPEIVWSDNTMAAAAKENTGGSRFRHRFSVRDDDPVGLFTQFGVDLRFTLPAHGQSKPIENAFSTLSRYIAKAPECAGAYTGNSPVNKPANYGSKTVALDVLAAVCEREIAWYNARQTQVKRGPTAGRSRDQAFDESYAQAVIRKATAEQLRPWMLAIDGVTCRKPDGSVWLHQNRYWHQALVGLMGRKVTLRFDPEALHQPVHVYRLDGSFVCTAPCVEDTGFADRAAGKAHAAAKRAFGRASRKMVESERLLSARQMAALQGGPEDSAPPPSQRVVGAVFGGAKAQVREVWDLEDEAEGCEEAIDFFGALGAGLRLVREQDSEGEV
jgi:hypothetical protein